VAALALGPRLEAGSAPPQPDVPDGWRDPLGRFAPVGARAWVLVRRPRARLPVEPLGLSDLANPKLAPRVALGPPAAGLGPLAVATLSLAYGERSARRFLQLLARNGAQLAASDEAARGRVAAGEADVALVSSVEGARGAASAAGLEVVYPDQSGRGAVVIPTAAALLRGASPAGRALAAWLAGPDAERLLVARAPGLLPLRASVPVPVGVEPAQNLRTLPLDWELLPPEVARLAPPLAGWPEGPFGGRPPRP
jgi:iron(III) transport system substrate-binding protein